MKPGVLFYFLTILLALATGAGGLWKVFFPVTIEKRSDSLNTQVALVASAVTEINIVALSAVDLWNIEAKNLTGVVACAPNAISQWIIELQKDNTWSLSHKDDKENSWIFQGVLYRDTHYSAILYNANISQKWFFVRQDDFFEGLKVMKVTHEGMILQDAEQKEWKLGLFHTKQQGKRDKIK